MQVSTIGNSFSHLSQITAQLLETMDELTPLKSKIAQSSELQMNPAVALAANRLKRGPIASKISFSLKERQRALSQVGVGQAAHLCRDGEMARRVLIFLIYCSCSMQTKTIMIIVFQLSLVTRMRRMKDFMTLTAKNILIIPQSMLSVLSVVV